MDALQLLREDHQHVKELFRKFEDADSPREQKRFADEAIMELDIHAQIEEEIFYPAIRKLNSDIDDIMNEADEEHHVAKLLMTELAGMPPSDDHFEAKFTVLAENVKHHIQEEESEMLPKAAEAGRAKLDKLGERMEARKAELKRTYTGHKRETYEATTATARKASTNGRKRTTPARTRTTNARRTTATARTTGTRRTTTTRTRGAATPTRAATTKRTTASRPRTAATRSRTSATTRTRTTTARSRVSAPRRTASGTRR